MAQISALIKTLKKQLRAGGKTYSDVAAHLELSEASVKRLFSEQSFTLQRLEQVCNLLNLQLTELVQLMESEQLKISQLTFVQEKEIASDLVLLLVCVSVMSGFTYQDVLAQYDIKSTECIQKLAILDRLKIIELLPNNRIKLLIARNFSWLPNGPIQTFFRQKVEQDYFNCRFDGEQEQLVVLNGLLSSASNSDFQIRIRRLATEFNDLAQQDFPLPMEKKFGNTVVLAIRRWQFKLFDEYRNKS